MSATKILVIDDDRDLVATLRIVLESGGYAVAAAYGLEEGLEQTETERPDLILLDIMMPNATEGFHFVWRLRKLADEYFQRVPIIVVTAIHETTSLRFYPDSADGSYKAGEFLPVQDFLDKPIDPGTLLDRVEKILRVSRSK
jgi:CheY-like chemotaxis protein